MALDPKYAKELQDAVEQQRPLSWRDRWHCYILSFLTLLGGLCGMFLTICLARPLSAMLVPEALWAAEGGKFLWGLGGCTLLVLVGAFMLGRLEQGKPTAYKPGLVLTVLGFAMIAMSVLGGSYLYADGTVKNMDAFGRETASYAPEQIERVFVEIRTGKSQTQLYLTLRTEDQKLLTFAFSDIPETEQTRVRVLRDVLEDFSEVRTEFDGAWNLERFYRDFPCSEEDRAYLEWLFGMGTGGNYDGT